MEKLQGGQFALHQGEMSVKSPQLYRQGNRQRGEDGVHDLDGYALAAQETSVAADGFPERVGDRYALEDGERRQAADLIGRAAAPASISATVIPQTAA